MKYNKMKHLKVSLRKNTRMIGGKLAGTISGTPKNPAILQWRFYDYLS
jgi:hypothetical protein